MEVARPTSHIAMRHFDRKLLQRASLPSPVSPSRDLGNANTKSVGANILFALPYRIKAMQSQDPNLIKNKEI